MLYVSGQWYFLTVGSIAQWLEPSAHNGLVAGSIPAGSIMRAYSQKIDCMIRQKVVGEHKVFPDISDGELGVAEAVITAVMAGPEP